MANALTVVMYHHVFGDEGASFPGLKGLDIDTFRKQLAGLREKHTFVTMDQVLGALNGTPLPERAALLTFDDGYLEHALTVLPVLLEERVEGSFYPAAMPVVERKLLDSNKIHFLLTQLPPARLAAALLEERQKLNDPEPNHAFQARLSVAFRYDTPEVTFIKRALQKELPAPHRTRILNSLFRQHVTLDERAIAEEFYMDSQQVTDLFKAGMTIGNHGWAHPWLDTLTEMEQEADIFKGLEAVKKWTEGTRPWTFCYPYGAGNESTRNILEKLGCSAAFTTEVAEANVTAGNRLALPRFDTNHFL